MTKASNDLTTLVAAVFSFSALLAPIAAVVFVVVQLGNCVSNSYIGEAWRYSGSKAHLPAREQRALLNKNPFGGGSQSAATRAKPRAAAHANARYEPKPRRDFAPQQLTRLERRRILQALCREKGIDATVSQCWKLFEAICMVESTCRQNAYNPELQADDGYASYGWFQIRVYYHQKANTTALRNVTLKCAYDFACAAEWAMDYALENGVRQNVSGALYRHNGAVSPIARATYLGKIRRELFALDAGAVPGVW